LEEESRNREGEKRWAKGGVSLVPGKNRKASTKEETVKGEVSTGSC